MSSGACVREYWVGVVVGCKCRSIVEYVISPGGIAEREAGPILKEGGVLSLASALIDEKRECVLAVALLHRMPRGEGVVRFRSCKMRYDRYSSSVR